MSAYVVDPRTIDYLVAFAHRRRTSCDVWTREVWRTWAEIPENLAHAVRGDNAYGYRLNLSQVDADDLGQILMDENVRSVAHRYPNDAPDELPGPAPEHPSFQRIRAYTFHPVPDTQPEWVLSCCRCLEYQSCETPEWENTPANRILDALTDKAISALIERADAPWGVTQEDIDRPAKEYRAKLAARQAAPGSRTSTTNPMRYALSPA